jgi:DNA ligase-associated metallophosphoesterase
MDTIVRCLLRCYIHAVLSAEISVAGERLLLHPHRALFWPRMRWLIVSDLHLGKAAHFRKVGAALPEGQDEGTLDRLDALIANFRPERLMLLGDLFHSSHNSSWAPFTAWALRQRLPLHLVPGNHDILAERRYAEAGIQVCDGTLEVAPFVFAHEPQHRPGYYGIGGHIHPGVVLSGRGRQRLRLSCFWFGERLAILPAFGLSTGLHLIRPERTDRVYACTEQAVLDVNGAFSGRATSPHSK